MNQSRVARPQTELRFREVFPKKTSPHSSVSIATALAVGALKRAQHHKVVVLGEANKNNVAL